MHKVADTIEAAVQIPLLHIGDVTAEAIKKTKDELRGVAGICFTMSESFYKDLLSQKHGIKALVPDSDEREFIHNTIHKELMSGQPSVESRKEILRYH